MNHKRNYQLAIIAALGGALLFAAMALFVRMCKDEVSFGQTLFIRGSCAVVILGIYYRRSLLPIFSFEAKSIWARSLFGAIAVACYFQNIREAPLAMAGLLNNISPVFVYVFSIALLNRRADIKTTFGVITTVAGAFLLLDPKLDGMTLTTIVLGFTGAAASALAYISLRSAAGTFQSGLVVFGFSIALVAISFLDPNILQVHSTSSSLMPLAGMVLASLSAQLLMTYSYKFLEPTIGSAINLTAVVWSVFIDIFLLDITFSIQAVFASLGILLGIGLLLAPRPQR